MRHGNRAHGAPAAFAELVLGADHRRFHMRCRPVPKLTAIMVAIGADRHSEPAAELISSNGLSNRVHGDPGIDTVRDLVRLARDMRLHSCKILADTQILYALYKKHHWLMRGATFYQLHLLLDKHADEQNELIDKIAERSEALRSATLGTSSSSPKSAVLRTAAKKFQRCSPGCLKRMRRSWSTRTMLFCAERLTLPTPRSLYLSGAATKSCGQA